MPKEQEWQELEGDLRVVTWLEKFLSSTDDYKGTTKEYNLRLEICSAELFNELRGLIQVSVYKDFREFPFPKLQEHRGLKNNTLFVF